MTDALLLPHTGPFVTALLVCFFLLALSLLGLGGDSDGGLDAAEGGGPEVDLSDGLSGDTLTDLDAELDALAHDTDGPAEPISGTSAGPLSSALGFLNPGGVPTGVLIALIACGYGVSGMLVQMLAASSLGAPLSPLTAGLALIPAGLLSGRLFGGWLGRAIPNLQTAAVHAGHLKGARADISQGRAEIGRPARARVDARRVGGQLINVDVTPYKPGDSFPEGTRVVLLQKDAKGTWIAGRIPVD